MKSESRDVMQIFLILIITGNLMVIVLIQIFREQTLLKLVQMEVILIAIVVLFVGSSTLWKKKLARMKNNNFDRKPSNTKSIKDTRL